MATPVNSKSSSLCDCFKKKQPKKEETKVQVAAKPVLKQYPQIQEQQQQQHNRMQSTEVITILQALREQNEIQKKL